MANRIYLAKNFFFEVEVSFTQLVIIAVMSLLMFFGPVYLHSRLKNSQIVAQEPQPVTETYTQTALSRNTTGEVAGTSTERAPVQSEIKIPLFNINFDPTFREPSSLPIAFGFIFGTVSLTIIVILSVDYLRK